MSLPPEIADTFGSLSLAALGVENRDPHSTRVHLEEAARTAPAAFPPDSGASAALSVLLAEIETLARMAGLSGAAA